jgi:uncharacterized membrane protein (UPF0127 family)
VRIETWLDADGRRWTIVVAGDRRARRRGLLGLDGLARRSGLLLPRCRSVHTVGMRFPVDVVLLDERLVVRRVIEAPAGRIVLPRAGGRHVLEVAAGSGLLPGDRFVVQPTSSTSPDRRTTTVRGVSVGTVARISSAARRR